MFRIAIVITAICFFRPNTRPHLHNSSLMFVSVVLNSVGAPMNNPLYVRPSLSHPRLTPPTYSQLENCVSTFVNLPIASHLGLSKRTLSKLDPLSYPLSKLSRSVIVSVVAPFAEEFIMTREVIVGAETLGIRTRWKMSRQGRSVFF